MPIVLTDSTNRVWAVEQSEDRLIHVGVQGSAGPALVDILDFIHTRQNQFNKFVTKKREKEDADKRRLRRTRKSPRYVESGGDSSP